MLTSVDIKLLVENFKTRQEADDDLRRLEERLEGKLLSRQEFNEKFDIIMTGLDKVVGELQTVRIEQGANQVAHDRIDEDLAAIKSVPVIAHDLKFKK